MLKINLTIAFIVFATPVLAAETDWVDVAPDTRVRLISSDVLTNGKTTVGLELDMPAHVKTYWRIPGESGIPTTIDASQSQNVSGHQIVWPFPHRENKDGFIDFVYYGPTVLPINVDMSGDNGLLKLDILMGVCSDICVPVRSSLTLPLDFSRRDNSQGLRLRQAMADVPVDWGNATQPFGDIRFNDELRQIEIAVDSALIDPQYLIIDTGDPAVLFGMPQKSQTDEIITFELLGKTLGKGLYDTPLRLTFETADGVFTLARTVSSKDASAEQ